MRRRALAPALLALLALPAAGCGATGGSEDAPTFRGQQQLVAQAIEELEDAASGGDEARICRELLARALADRLGGTGDRCEQTVEDALEDSDTSDLTVRAVQVQGTTATARVEEERGDADRTRTIALAREGGRWRISRLG